MSQNQVLYSVVPVLIKLEVIVNNTYQTRLTTLGIVLAFIEAAKLMFLSYD